jgi:hypothetical protein
MSAGAATSGPEGADALGCVADAVREIDMPDPGSYPAKVSFEVP